MDTEAEIIKEIREDLYTGKFSIEDAQAKALKVLELDLKLAYCQGVNIREITIAEVQEALDAGKFSTEDLTKTYLARIEALNPHLNAVIEINPDALLIAKKLDAQRKESGPTSPLHGIPILIKENIGTADKMETCAGSLALVGLKPKEDSEVVKRLRAAGAVILGKANLSEFANYRDLGWIPDGWSGRGGRTKNAHSLTKSSSGSSSGSAVGVAANLCVVSLGTETNGSIVSPASLGSIVGLKPTVGFVPGKGVIPLAASQDSVGPMARTVRDAALLYSVISNTSLTTKCFDVTNLDLNSCLSADLKVGVLRHPLWDESDESQLPELQKALEQLKKSGVEVQDPVEVSEEALMSVRRDAEQFVFSCEFKSGLNDYLCNTVCPVQNSSGNCNRIKSLSDIIEFNKKNPGPENYSQGNLEAAESKKGIDEKNYVTMRESNKSAAKKLIDDLLATYGLDAIVGPTDSPNTSSYPAVSGYPIISVPVGFAKDGVPFGISFFGTEGSEEKLLLISARLESVFKGRRPPIFWNESC